ncbi:MAG TPA: hypothetical protein VJX74_03150 [Blastocatellia bacterium]|nr:hypothetical protein [Blastocatellia bacterium]
MARELHLYICPCRQREYTYARWGVDLNAIQRGGAEAALLPATRMKRKD